MLEVLAPIGSIQALKAAIYSGADAVYLGLDLFNARIKADNFTKDNLRQYVEYCHLFGVKVYVTFNTAIKSSEMQVFAEYVDIAAKAKVDAFIVTDLGTLDIFKKYNVPLHGSTQIGVHNLAGARVLEELGFSRVVLARETLIEDIVKIKQNTSLEIEYFVHGALCVCFSGSCLMSSMMSGDSGNRGRCNQPCRLKYSSTFSNEEKYLLSPKDQCLIDKIEELYRAGVDSLKIEGRLKQPHYVGGVVSEYRKAVDNILLNKTNSINKSALLRGYNRGNFTLGYNYENSKSIIFEKINGNIGEEIGEIVSCKNGILKIKAKSTLNVGDGVKIIKNGKEAGGFCITNIKFADGLYLVRTNKIFESRSKVCLTFEKSQVDRFNTISPKLSIKFTLTALVGKKLSIKAVYNDICVEVVGDTVEMAKSLGTTKKDIVNQLLRLGDSDFVSNEDNIQFIHDEGEQCFLPKSTLNNMRREVVEKLRNEIISNFEKSQERKVYQHVKSITNDDCKLIDNNNLYVEIDGSEESIAALKELDCKFNLCLKFSQNMSNITQIILNNNLIKNNLEHIFLRLPRIARGRDYDIIEKILLDANDSYDGIIADNLYAVYLAKKFNKLLIGGIGLNIFNNQYSKVLGLDRAINSVELNKNELLDEEIIYGYGRLPIMTLLHCPVQVNTKCDCKTCKYNGEFSYYDRRGEYRISRYKLNFCQFELYNQQIIDIRSKIQNFNSDFYLDLRGLKRDEILRILSDFVKKSGISVDNSTYGHLYRGVK